MSLVTKLFTKKLIQIGTESIESAFGVGDLLMHTQVNDRTKVWGRFVITGIDFKQTYDKKKRLEGSFIYTCMGCHDNDAPKQSIFTQTWLYDRINMDYVVIPYCKVDIDKAIEPIKKIYINLQNDQSGSV